MRVIRMKRKGFKTVLVVVGLVGIGLLLAGGVLGNPFLLGAGAASLIFTCGGFISSKETMAKHIV